MTGPARTILFPAIVIALALHVTAATPAPPATAAPESRPVTAVAEIQKWLDQGDFVSAERGARSLLAESERDHGDMSEVAGTAVDLLLRALMGGQNSRLQEARGLAERSVAIKERTLGPDHLETANSLNTLGKLLYALDGPAAARLVWARAVAIREKALGPEHVDVARGLNNVSICLIELGRYAEARRALERSLHIMEAKKGPDHHDTSIVRNTLGVLLRRMGDYAEARKQFERIIDFQASHGGEEPIGTLNNLAILLRDSGEMEKARDLHERVLEWTELRQDHPDRALYNLAYDLWRLGDLERARVLAEQALEHRRRLLAGDPEDLEASDPEVLLGSILTDSGRPSEAIGHFETGLEIQKRLLGSLHPDVASSLVEYGRMQWTLGQEKEALATALQVEEMARGHFLETAGVLTEREALLLENVRIPGRDLALSALARKGKTSAADVRAVWDQTVRSRSLVLDTIGSRQRIAWAMREPALASLLEALEKARHRFSRHLVSGPGEGGERDYTQILAALRADKEQAERAMAERSAIFRKVLEREKAGLPEVLSALPQGASLVAYVLYNRLPAPGVASPKPGEAGRPTASYAALIARSGGRLPLFVPLGEAGQIDSLIESYLASVGRRPVRPMENAPDDPAQRETGEELRRLIWDPVAREISDTTPVFIVPDGAIHRLSMATLPTEAGRYLVETGPLLHYLSAERDLVRLQAPVPHGSGLLALGGPDFERRRAPEAASVATLAAAGPSGQPTYRSAPAACGEMASLRFDRLVAAGKEAEEVESLWRSGNGTKRDEAGGQALTLTGPAATEDAFKAQAPGRRILHVATHAFSMQERCGAAGDNLLHLSGLALAGANQRQQVPLDGTEEDGILTAEEIASLDLSGVEWAVLSACATGAGPVRSGEGVPGLRRAFEIAGVSTVIMSLWDVEDSAARAWMRRLYEGRLAGLSTAAAVRQASLDQLESQRRNGRTTHPFFWGAFIAAGDWH
jgi:CHAT domain-containing protein/tetratricopeptide (TPR) repeat protein